MWVINHVLLSNCSLWSIFVGKDLELLAVLLRRSINFIPMLCENVLEETVHLMNGLVCYHPEEFPQSHLNADDMEPGLQREERTKNA